MKITLLGDLLLTYNISKDIQARTKNLSELLNNSDFVLGNLETTLTTSVNLFPSFESGGSWIKLKENVDDVFSFYNINCVNFANNHSLDFSYKGLSQTLKELEKNNIAVVGAGQDIQEASKMKSTNDVGIIAATTSYSENWRAGPKNDYYLSRPGINGLRLEKVNFVPSESYIMLKNLYKYLFNKESAILSFGKDRFVLGNSYKSILFIHPNDRSRLEKEIKKSKMDTKILSLHYHYEWDETNIPYFLSQIVEESINNGVKIIMCHGPHDNKIFTIQKNYVVFWGLGNFIYHIDDLNDQPSEFDLKYSIPPNIKNSQDKLNYRKNLLKNNVSSNKKNWSSFLPEIKIEENEIISVKIFPITLDFNNYNNHKGWPNLTNDFNHVNTLVSHSNISKDFSISLEDDHILIKRKKIKENIRIK